MPTKRVPTTEKLAIALQKAHAPMSMIKRARAGAYDDFKSHIAHNIVLLVEDCRKHGLEQIAQRAINGDFDAQNWEAEEWSKTAEGREVFKEFGLEPK